MGRFVLICSVSLAYSWLTGNPRRDGSINQSINQFESIDRFGHTRRREPSTDWIEMNRTRQRPQYTVYVWFLSTASLSNRQPTTGAIEGSINQWRREERGRSDTALLFCGCSGRVALVVAVDILAGGERVVCFFFFLPPFGNLGGETFVFDVISCPHSQLSLPSAFSNTMVLSRRSRKRVCVGRVS